MSCAGPGVTGRVSEREARGARVDGGVKVRCASKSSPDATFCPPSLRDGGGTRGHLNAAPNLPGHFRTLWRRPTLLGKIAPRHAISLKLPPRRGTVARYSKKLAPRRGTSTRCRGEDEDVQRGDAQSNERGGSDPGH